MPHASSLVLFAVLALARFSATALPVSQSELAASATVLTRAELKPPVTDIADLEKALNSSLANEARTRESVAKGEALLQKAGESAALRDKAQQLLTQLRLKHDKAVNQTRQLESQLHDARAARQLQVEMDALLQEAAAEESVEAQLDDVMNPDAAAAVAPASAAATSTAAPETSTTQPATPAAGHPIQVASNRTNDDKKSHAVQHKARPATNSTTTTTKPTTPTTTATTTTAASPTTKIGTGKTDVVLQDALGGSGHDERDLERGNRSDTSVEAAADIDNNQDDALKLADERQNLGSKSAAAEIGLPAAKVEPKVDPTSFSEAEVDRVLGNLPPAEPVASDTAPAAEAEAEADQESNADTLLPDTDVDAAADSQGYGQLDLQDAYAKQVEEDEAKAAEAAAVAAAMAEVYDNDKDAAKQDGAVEDDDGFAQKHGQELKSKASGLPSEREDRARMKARAQQRLADLQARLQQSRESVGAATLTATKSAVASDHETSLGHVDGSDLSLDESASSSSSTFGYVGIFALVLLVGSAVVVCRRKLMHGLTTSGADSPGGRRGLRRVYTRPNTGGTGGTAS